MNRIFRNIGVALCGVFIFVFLSNKVYGQIYFSGSLQYGFYNHDKPLELVDVSPNLSFGMGVKLYANQKSKFEISGELNSFRRNFCQKYDEGDYKYLFKGIEFRFLSSYALSDKWNMEVGVVAANYYPAIIKTGENLKVGEGFRENDIGSFLGCHYSLAKSLYLGARFDIWFVNMLKYQEIGKYGDLEPVVKDIRTNTAEIFIRFQFLNKWK